MTRIAPPDLSPWFAILHDLEGLIDWSELFGNDHPVEIDVGCGRGLFLVNSAQTHPDRNYLGIETDYQKGRHATRRLIRRQLTNARVLGGDGQVFLHKQVPTGSVSALHVYFPDPWWKRRHRRRRVFCEEFVAIAARVLKPGGLLHSWTDVEQYFEVISGLMNHHPAFVPLAPPEERDPDHDMDYHTSFERKKRKAGCIIHRGLWQRCT